ncbi:MAG: hypothetical protein Q9164_007496 [Protoblastenia rupestris]
MFEDCLNGRCRCECHDEIYEDNGWRWEAGVFKTDEKDGLPFERNGVFPFLKLAGETRERIYGYTFLQDGNRRYSVNHRGTIHTALLHTCREVYNEARHMPLTINRLCFATPVDTLEFLGFFLAPSVRPLFTGLDIELQYVDWPADACVAALRQLAKMPIAHLGLTVKGVYFAEAFRGRSCFVKRIAVFKHIKSFDLRLASYYVPYQIKKEIEEEMRCKLIKGYARKADIDKEGKAAKLKRSASSETDNKAYKSKKKAKKSCQTVRSLKKHSDAVTDQS